MGATVFKSINVYNVMYILLHYLILGACDRMTFERKVTKFLKLYMSDLYHKMQIVNKIR